MAIRAGACEDASEETVKVGARVTLLNSRAAFETAFKSAQGSFSWDNAMMSLLGRTVTVVQRPETGVFGLPESKTDSGRPLLYPLSVITCVQGPNP